MKKKIIAHNFVGIVTAILSLALMAYDFIILMKAYFLSSSRLVAFKSVNPLSIILIILLMVVSFYFMNLADKETARYHKMLKKKKLQQKRVAS